MTIALEDQKKAARGAAAKIRKIAHEQQQEAAPLVLAARGLPVAPKTGAAVVSGFHPYKSEINVVPLLGKLLGEGWVTSLPIVLGDGLPLEFRRWFPGEPLIEGAWGILRPSETAEIVQPDVLIVPMLAFDRQGFRLGYGGGFYDRSLEQLRALKPIVAIGAAYAAQEVESVPHAEHDQPLDFIITESELIKCV